MRYIKILKCKVVKIQQIKVYLLISLIERGLQLDELTQLG